MESQVISIRDWLLIVLVGLCTCACQSPIAKLPKGFHATDIYCDSGSVVFLGASNQRSGDGNALSEQRAVAVWVTKNGHVEQAEIGTGFVADATRTPSRTLYAVVVERLATEDIRRVEASRLFRSDDFGRSWKEIDTSLERIIGTEFGSSNEGFAWTSREVSWTNDAGATWRSAGSPLELDRQRGRAVVTDSGSLVIAWRHGPLWAASSNALVTVDPSLSFEVQLVNSSYNIAEIAPGDSGAVILLRRDENSSSAGLELSSYFPNQKEPPVKIAELQGRMTDYLDVSGSRIVFAASNSPTGTRFAMTSEDGGITWTYFRPAERRVRSWCATNDGVWMLGSLGSVYYSTNN